MIEFLARVDHLVYAAPDLEAGVAQVERLLGVRACPGGRHSDWGTRNALIGLGPGTYLEIIGRDPDLPRPPRGRPFRIDALSAPRLVTWAAKATDLDRISAQAMASGLYLGEVASGSRRRPDGQLLTWRLTDVYACAAGGVVPFCIDWGATEHPSAGLPHGCRLAGLRGAHPEAAAVQGVLRVLGLDLTVVGSNEPALVATIETGAGRVELR